MKVVFGGPGRKSGLMLRIGQFLCAGASIGVMVSASGFSSATAFCYLIASMGLQFLWSIGLACFDLHALMFNNDLENHIALGLFVVGDWVIATLSLAAACSSTGVVVLLSRDTNFCASEPELSCGMFKISMVFAFASWFLLAISSHIMFCIAASI